MPKLNKIKRAITWIRTTLEITDVTTTPGQILDEIRPALDIFGWERYEDLISTNVGTANTDTANLTLATGVTAIPVGFLRLFVALSGETNDTVLQFTHWMEVDSVAVTQPVLLPVSAATIIKAGGLAHPILVAPGVIVRARCAPATAGGITLRVRGSFLDIPIGEYLKSI